MEPDCTEVRGTSIRSITLPLPEWREVYRILDNDGHWHNVTKEIEKQCRKQTDTATVELMQAWAWSMSSTVRQTHPEIADRMAMQLGMEW